MLLAVRDVLLTLEGHLEHGESLMFIPPRGRCGQSSGSSGIDMSARGVSRFEMQLASVESEPTRCGSYLHLDDNGYDDATGLEGFLAGHFSDLCRI